MKRIRLFLLHHATAAIFVAALSLLGTIDLWIQFESSHSQLRSSILEQSEQRAIQLSDVISNQFAFFFHDIDFALRELREAWLIDRDNFKAASKSIIARFPDRALNHITVIGSDGFITYSNRDINGRENVGKLDYFQKYTAEGTDSIHIGQPVYSTVSNQWDIHASRPILRNAEFEGVIVIGLSPKYLAAELAKVKISKQDIIVSLNMDGSFLARNTNLEKALGRSVKKERPFLTKDAPVSGVFQAPATLDSIPRIFGWTILHKYGVIIVVGLNQNQLLKPIDQEYVIDRRRIKFITLIVLVLGGSVSLLLLRLSRQQKTLQTSRKSLSEAQRITHVGNWELDLVSNQLSWSDEIFRIFGIDQQQFEVSYDAFIDITHPDDRDKVDEQFKASIERRMPCDIEHRIIRRNDGSLRWVHERCEHIYNHKGEVIHSIGTIQDITERKYLEDELRKLATTDFLTGLHTRRYFINRLEDELARFHRAMGQPVSLLMIDLDHFKQINDNYGHATGDKVLKHFSGLVRDELRRIDMAGRLGGEEFGLILPGTNTDAAMNYAERIRERIANSPLMLNDQHISFNISIGVTELKKDDKVPDDILERADKALYRAKELGRNRVEVSDRN